MDDSNKFGHTWLPTFLKLEYFTEECTHCMKKCQNGFFCVDCCKGPLCPTVRKAEHKGHKDLQVRKVSKSFSVKVADIASLVNVDYIHTYVINSATVVFLPTRKHDKKSGNGYNCESCRRYLQNNGFEVGRFCSISCKAKAIVDSPFDTSVTLAVVAGVSSLSNVHSSAKDLSGWSDVPRPPSLYPSIPEKKQAMKRPQGTKDESAMVPPGPSCEKKKRAMKKKQKKRSMKRPQKTKNKSAMVSPSLSCEKMHRKDNDPISMPNIPVLPAGECSRLFIKNPFSFRKKARKGLPIRAPGVGIQQWA